MAVASAGALTVGLLTATLGGTAHAQQPAERAGKSVDLALKASGFGSRATGGDVPSESDETAYIAIGCATRVGIDRENHETEVTYPDLGQASNVKTEVWTRRAGDAISSYTRNSIQKLVIAQSGLGSVELRGIVSFARAWHDNQGFHAHTRTNVGSITLMPEGGGEPQELEAPSPGQPVEVPGIATIAVGTIKERLNADGAHAQANALIIEKTASGSRSVISQAKAQALTGVKHGIFRGFSAATQGTAADGHVTSGRTPLTLMPCQGTRGKVWSKRSIDSDLGGQLLATGLKTEQMGKELAKRSTAYERATVSHMNLGGGQLDVEGIVGQANVTREGRKVTTSIKGSKVGTIVANGEEQEFPDTGVLEIPGVAKLERFVVEKIPSGIHVVALRVTLLDGSGSVFDFGQARLQIRPN
ncbi:hypothetical protein JCM10369A_07060 [Nocardioides pyridinolyticus]